MGDLCNKLHKSLYHTNIMKHGKKYRAVLEKIDKNNTYSLIEGIKLIQENKIAKFDESIEVHIKTKIDPKKGDQQVRGTVVLPHGTGKTKKIAVITTTKADEAKAAGADLVAGEELIEKIKSGKIEFDVLVATPEMMPKLASVAKVLGPKGLMPNPKTETVTPKIKEAVESLKKGKASFKNDNSGNIHQLVGKISFEENKLVENVESFLKAVDKSKPAAVKGKLISTVTICSTMGVGIKISL